MAALSGRMLAPYLVLFAALYSGFGVQSPYLPTFLGEHGLQPETIGVVLAGGTAIKLLAGPAAGRLADRLNAATLVFAGCAVGAALTALGYLPAYGFWPLLAVALSQAAMLAPLAPLGDSLVLPAAADDGRTGHRGFDYGWVRGKGSGAFILGSVLSGQAVGLAGIDTAIWLNTALLLTAALCASQTRPLPPRPTESAGATPFAAAHIGTLLRLPVFRRVVLVAALILGSHALHDGFAMIRWRAAGVTPGTAGLLWAEAVAAEVVVFFALGRTLLDRIGPSGAAMLAATAGVLRWAVSAETTALPALALIQPMHGLTFALLHLACMRRLAETVPPGLSATALTLYGTVGIGAASALLTLLAGVLYGAVGAVGFWVMAALCAAALPFARRM